MRYLEFYSYIVFSSVQAAVSTEAIRVSGFELVHIHLQDFFEVVAYAVCPDCEIPSDITEFLCDMLKIKVVSLKAVFLYKVCDFSAFATQSECGVHHQFNMC